MRSGLEDLHLRRPQDDGREHHPERHGGPAAGARGSGGSRRRLTVARMGGDRGSMPTIRKLASIAERPELRNGETTPESGSTPSTPPPISRIWSADEHREPQGQEEAVDPLGAERRPAAAPDDRSA